MCKININIEEQDTVVILNAKVSGNIPTGSESNTIFKILYDKLENQLNNITEQNNIGLVLNLLDAQYNFGDSISTLWIMPLAKFPRIIYIIVAQGDTKKHILNALFQLV